MIPGRSSLGNQSRSIGAPAHTTRSRMASFSSCGSFLQVGSCCGGRPSHHWRSRARATFCGHRVHVFGGDQLAMTMALRQSIRSIAPLFLRPSNVNTNLPLAAASHQSRAGFAYDRRSGQLPPGGCHAMLLGMHMAQGLQRHWLFL